MPLEDLAEGLFRILGRIILHILADIVFEILIQGAGYLILKPFYRNKTLDADGWAVTVVGILFWLILLVAIFFIYREFFAAS